MTKIEFFQPSNLPSTAVGAEIYILIFLIILIIDSSLVPWLGFKHFVIIYLNLQNFFTILKNRHMFQYNLLQYTSIFKI